MQRLAADGMDEAERSGMQRDSLADPARMLCLLRPVTWVTQYRVACIGKMDTNLVSLAGL